MRSLRKLGRNIIFFDIYLQLLFLIELFAFGLGMFLGQDGAMALLRNSWKDPSFDPDKHKLHEVQRNAMIFAHEVVWLPAILIGVICFLFWRRWKSQQWTS